MPFIKKREWVWKISCKTFFAFSWTVFFQLAWHVYLQCDGCFILLYFILLHIFKWINGNLSTRVKASQLNCHFYLLGEGKLVFSNWLALSTNHTRTDLTFRSTWPTYNRLHNFVCVLLFGYSMMFLFSSSSWEWFYFVCFVLACFIAILSFVYFFEKELKVAWEEEKIWKDLGEGMNMILKYT